MSRKKLHKKGFDKMKIFRKCFAVAMALIITCSAFTVMPLTTSAATNNNVSVSASSTKSGKCGKNVKWTYKNNVLTIYGKGKMTSRIPRKVAFNAKKIIVKNGVTNINKLRVSEDYDRATDQDLDYKNYKLEEVEIADSVTESGKVVFCYCTKLKKIKFSANATSLSYENIPACIESVTLPKKIEVIDSGTFMYCEKLRNIKLPSSVDTIFAHAFEGCTNLKEINLPKKLELLDSSAFSDCKSLKKVDLPKKIKKIGANPFSGCDKLSKITLDKSNKRYKVVGNTLFDKSLKRIVLYIPNNKKSTYTVPSNVKEIGKDAFKGNKNLKTIKMSDSVTSVGACAFAETTKLRNVKLSNKITFWGDKAFNKSNIYNVKSNWKDNILYCDNAVVSCKNKTKIANIKKGSKYILSNVFSYSPISKLTIPSGVTYIGKSAFAYCTNLKKVDIPNSVTQMNKFAFYYCSSLSKVKLSDNLTDIPYGAFTFCKSLTKITFPKNLKNIGEKAFFGCEKIPEIILPNKVEFIDEAAFANCFNLSKLTLNEGLLGIGAYAFELNKKLKKVTIPKSVFSIGEYALGYLDGGTYFYPPVGDSDGNRDDSFKFTVYKGTEGESYVYYNGFKNYTVIE